MNDSISISQTWMVPSTTRSQKCDVMLRGIVALQREKHKWQLCQPNWIAIYFAPNKTQLHNPITSLGHQNFCRCITLLPNHLHWNESFDCILHMILTIFALSLFAYNIVLIREMWDVVHGKVEMHRRVLEAYIFLHGREVALNLKATFCCTVNYKVYDAVLYKA